MADLSIQKAQAAIQSLRRISVEAAVKLGEQLAAHPEDAVKIASSAYQTLAQLTKPSRSSAIGGGLFDPMRQVKVLFLQVVASGPKIGDFRAGDFNIINKALTKFAGVE